MRPVPDPGPIGSEVTPPLMVVSPHLDDGVFGCGDLIGLHPGATVVTVFAGAAPAEQPLTDWDRNCGFRDGMQAMAQRRAEDAAALKSLDARPLWLDFPDAQYRGQPLYPGALAECLRAVLDAQSPPTIVAPLGVFHDDHRLTSEALLQLHAADARADWLVYADALYRFIPGLRAERLEELASRGLTLEPMREQRVATQRKRDAAAHYASQLRALRLPGHVSTETIFAPEQYWRLR